MLQGDSKIFIDDSIITLEIFILVKYNRTVDIIRNRNEITGLNIWRL